MLHLREGIVALGPMGSFGDLDERRLQPGKRHPGGDTHRVLAGLGFPEQVVEAHVLRQSGPSHLPTSVSGVGEGYLDRVIRMGGHKVIDPILVEVARRQTSTPKSGCQVYAIIKEARTIAAKDVEGGPIP